MELKVFIPMTRSEIRFKKKLDKMLSVYGLSLDEIYNMKNLINGMNELLKQDEKEIAELRATIDVMNAKPLDKKKADPSSAYMELFEEMTGERTPTYTGGE